MVRAGLTAAKVTEAAAEFVDEVGADGLSVSALARRLGVRDASLYSHVKSLRDLRVRIALLTGVEMTDRIAAAVAGRAGKDALIAFADAYRQYALDHPGRYIVRHTTREVKALVDEVVHKMDVHTLEPDPAGDRLELNDIGSVKLRLSGPLVVDLYRRNRETGAFILIDEATNATVGAGMIDRAFE